MLVAVIAAVSHHAVPPELLMPSLTTVVTLNPKGTKFWFERLNAVESELNEDTQNGIGRNGTARLQQLTSGLHEPLSRSLASAVHGTFKHFVSVGANFYSCPSMHDKQKLVLHGALWLQLYFLCIATAYKYIPDINSAVCTLRLVHMLLSNTSKYVCSVMLLLQFCG